MVYETDPHSEPDDSFTAGAPRYAVPGNQGRLRDARRTPLSIVEVEPERGEIEVRIEGFEDRGARWRIPVWELGRLQFACDSRQAERDVIDALHEAGQRFNRPLAIGVDNQVASDTWSRVAQQRASARELLLDFPRPLDLTERVARRDGDPALFAALEQYLAARDLVDLDERFCATMVSNPEAGELVKGHAIVLAELGLCPFSGTVVRDPALFDEPWSRERRAAHLIARLAFARELWDTCVDQPLMLFRAAAAEEPLTERPARSFVSCTFSRNVAEAHFAGGASTTCAVMWRQVLSPERLFMSFLETAAMNRRFREAEAVLIGDPANPAF